jgi:hypothetical protein
VSVGSGSLEVWVGSGRLGVEGWVGSGVGVRVSLGVGVGVGVGVLNVSRWVLP